MTGGNANTGKGAPQDNSRQVIRNVLGSDKATVIQATIDSLGKRYIRHREKQQPDGLYTITFYVRSGSA